jgi:hypothetical protein
VRPGGGAAGHDCGRNPPLKAERDENACHEPLRPLAAVALAKKLAAFEEPAARERKRQGAINNNKTRRQKAPVEPKKLDRRRAPSDIDQSGRVNHRVAPAVAQANKIIALEEPDAEKRQRAGRQKGGRKVGGDRKSSTYAAAKIGFAVSDGEADSSPSNKDRSGRVSHRVAPAVGMSPRTLERAQTVVKAAEEGPRFARSGSN